MLYRVMIMSIPEARVTFVVVVIIVGTIVVVDAVSTVAATIAVAIEVGSVVVVVDAVVNRRGILEGDQSITPD